jgi:hypothetical protein
VYDDVITRQKRVNARNMIFPDAPFGTSDFRPSCIIMAW